MTASSSQSGKLPRAEPWETTTVGGVRRSQISSRQHPPGREKSCKPQAWLSPSLQRDTEGGSRAGWAHPGTWGVLVTGAYFPGMETSAWESFGRRKDRISSRTDLGSRPGVLTTLKGWLEAEAEPGKTWVAGPG